MNRLNTNSTPVTKLLNIQPELEGREEGIIEPQEDGDRLYNGCTTVLGTMPYLTRLAGSSSSLRRCTFPRRADHVGFVVDQTAQDSFAVFRFSSVSSHSVMLHIHSHSVKRCEYIRQTAVPQRYVYSHPTAKHKVITPRLIRLS